MLDTYLACLRSAPCEHLFLPYCYDSTVKWIGQIGVAGIVERLFSRYQIFLRYYRPLSIMKEFFEDDEMVPDEMVIIVRTCDSELVVRAILTAIRRSRQVGRVCSLL